jgi:hypothetical protein
LGFAIGKREGCSALWSERKVVAEGVRMRRMKRWVWVERAEAI